MKRGPHRLERAVKDKHCGRGEATHGSHWFVVTRFIGPGRSKTASMRSLQTITEYWSCK
jgi:hypothetical protein